ncbi:hypothetical protein [Leyella stercorea]|uniref:hypothetical protein n=1 Tax=Leyella stercorea TaxID=363265 RepID=UPI00243127D4|nr:hypothetical protein [Leyella stercorea]
MKKKTYKTLAGLLRANGAQQFTMSDFLSGEIYKRRYGEYVKFELTDSALRELSDGFCQALGCQKRKYDEVFHNMKYGRIQNCGILSRLWVELRGNKPSFTYCVGQDGDYEYPLVKRILYRGY